MFFWFLTIFILGTAVGSFLNVVIDRTVRGESFGLNRSYCDHCRATLGVFDLIPILSFVTLSGRCRYCQRPISWQYPAVESAAGLLFLLSFYTLIGAKFSLLTLFFYFFIVSIFLIVAAVDWKFSLIPTTFVFLASLVSLFFNYWTLSSWDFVVHVLSAFGLALVFATIVLVTFGRGMGTGDIPLAFLVGMVLGWPLSFVAIFSAFVLGGLVSVGLLVLGRKKFGQTIPFGPALVAGTLIGLFGGQELVNWYFSFLT